MNNYVQIRAGVIVGVQQSPRPLSAPDLVPVGEYAPDWIGRTWDGSKPGPAHEVVAQPAMATFLESLTEAEYAALEVRADSDYLVRQFLKVSEIRGFVDTESDLTAAALGRLRDDLPPSKRPPVLGRG